jgi:hypothetical protein
LGSGQPPPARMNAWKRLSSPADWEHALRQG